VGRRFKNLPALRQIGFAANRRVLEVEQLTHDCHIGTHFPREAGSRHRAAGPNGQRWQLFVSIHFAGLPGRDASEE
jgi:hypothetical protein